MDQSNDIGETAAASDQFVKRYLMVLGFLILAGIAYWTANLDSRVGEINLAQIIGEIGPILDRAVDVAVVKNDVGRFATEFQRQFFARAGGRPAGAF